MFTPANIATMLKPPLGRSVEINGQTTYAVIDTKQLVADGMGGLIVADPSASIATTDVAALFIEGGENGSQLLDGETFYRVLSVMDEGTGFSILRLEEER
jgi:hypothetical protein